MKDSPTNNTQASDLPPRKLGFWDSLVIFTGAAILMLLQTRYIMPWLSEITGQEIILFWFIVGGLGIFLPLILLGVVMLKKEGYSFTKQTWTLRLRFREVTRLDLLWCVAGLVVTGILSGLLMKVVEQVAGTFDHSPPFMAFETLSKGRYWLLLVWLPYWILNIMGEEFLWRGVMLPRQETVFGKYTWLFHGFGWGLFHIAFGWQLMVTLLPLIFVQSFVVQKSRNSWTGVIMHAAMNGPAFIAISFGLL